MKGSEKAGSHWPKLVHLCRMCAQSFHLNWWKFSINPAVSDSAFICASESYLLATALNNQKRLLCGIALDSLHKFPGGLVAKLPSPCPKGGQGHVEVGQSQM